MKLLKLPLILILSIAVTASAYSADVKEADLAGSWYPDSRTGLESMLRKYLDAASPEPVKGYILAIISPHAGYQYSGPVAAYGFKAAQKQNVSTVIILGFAHQKLFDGVSVYDKGSWRTPLGEIAVDEALAREIMSKNKRIASEPRLFDKENSVELQVPFIQTVFKDAKIVPIAFGGQNYEDVLMLAGALASVIKDRDDIILVASTDMSHYHGWYPAKVIDKRTMELLDRMDPKALYEAGRSGLCEMCGLAPTAAVILTARELGYNRIKRLKYGTSGDIAGDVRSVVGYLSAVVYKDTHTLSVRRHTLSEEKQGMLNESQRKRLLQIARESITSYVRDGKRKSFKEADPVLNRHMGAFVTLHENGELRGCIGNMVSHGPLYQTVADMAVEAATGDPRFSTLESQEIDKIDIEISVLSPLKKVSSYEDVEIPGHGVLVRRGFNSGVYLPQVATEAGWNREQFLTSLCGHKAGLAPDAWKDPATEIYTFAAEVFGEDHR